MQTQTRARRRAAAIVAAMLAVSTLVLVQARPAHATTDRVAGSDRYGTACEAAKRAFPGGATNVVVTTGRNFPDALAATALARDVQGPVLLTEPTSLPSVTDTCLDTLGSTVVWILGGPSAVSDAVAAALGSGRTVHRISGDDRFETAAAAAEAIADACILGGDKTALIATGDNFPDALAAGSVSSVGDGTNPCPLLLVHRDSIPQSTKDALSDLGITHIVILGGTGAISDAVLSALAALVGDTSPERLAGTTREGTAVDIADYLRDVIGCNIDTVLLANGYPITGQTFAPDPLSSGPLAGFLCAPILLTSGVNLLGSSASGWLDDNSADVDTEIAVGGTSVVSSSVLAAADAVAESTTTTSSSTSTTTTTIPQGAENGTSRPELTAATITFKLSQLTSGRPAGTYVKYTFDEAVNTPTASRFHVYYADDTQGPTGTVYVSDTTSTSITIRYDTLTTPADWETLTVASVDYGAVFDVGAAENPEGSRAIGASATSQLTGGKTYAPDLVSVGTFGVIDATHSSVKFNFDAAATAAAGGYRIITTSNDVITCAQTAGDGTTVHTLSCADAVAHPLTSVNVARGVVLPDTVESSVLTGSVANPLEAAKVSSDSGIAAPSLQSASVISHNGAFDRVGFVFNHSIVDGSVTAGDFQIYDVFGNTYTGDSKVSAGTSTVVIDFASNAPLLNIVGASVVPGAGNAVTSLEPIENDEVGLVNPYNSQRIPGYTVGPDLTGVSLQFVSGDEYALFTFDEIVASMNNDALFHLYRSNGTEFDGTSCVINSLNTKQVKCTAFGAATDSDINLSIIGTVEDSAVSDVDGLGNPEGAIRTTGGSGTPAT